MAATGRPAAPLAVASRAVAAAAASSRLEGTAPSSQCSSTEPSRAVAAAASSRLEGTAPSSLPASLCSTVATAADPYAYPCLAVAAAAASLQGTGFAIRVRYDRGTLGDLRQHGASGRQSTATAAAGCQAGAGQGTAARRRAAIGLRPQARAISRGRRWRGRQATTAATAATAAATAGATATVAQESHGTSRAISPCHQPPCLQPGPPCHHCRRCCRSGRLAGVGPHVAAGCVGTAVTNWARRRCCWSCCGCVGKARGCRASSRGLLRRRWWSCCVSRGRASSRGRAISRGRLRRCWSELVVGRCHPRGCVDKAAAAFVPLQPALGSESAGNGVYAFPPMTP